MVGQSRVGYQVPKPIQTSVTVRIGYRKSVRKNPAESSDDGYLSEKRAKPDIKASAMMTSGSSRQSDTSEKSLCRRLSIASALRCFRIPILPFCFFPSWLVIPIGSNHLPSCSQSPGFSEGCQKISHFFKKFKKKTFLCRSFSEDLYENEIPKCTVLGPFRHKRELLDG